jgi:hypothetical protein
MGVPIKTLQHFFVFHSKGKDVMIKNLKFKSFYLFLSHPSPYIEPPNTPISCHSFIELRDFGGVGSFRWRGKYDL